MRIAFASDHGGYELKCAVMEYLQEKAYDCVDFGTFDCETSVDYPDYAAKAAAAVINSDCEKGLLFCGTGQGIGISANKIKGIRCAIPADSYSAKMATRHNDANMIALGGRVLGKDLAIEIVDAYLGASFEAGRHERRVDKIKNLEIDKQL